jgi:cytoskeletal protein CcmA (bactofilin family)
MKNLLRALAVIPVLAVLAMAFTAPVAAADMRSGDTVVIGSGDVINDDLYIAANVITVNGVVNGDVLCVGATININGKVNGSVMALGETINIDGEVAHAVRAAAANVNVHGKIGGDLVVAGGNVDLADAAIILEDLLIGANRAKIDSSIGRDVIGLVGTMDLNGIVAGNIEVRVENLTIGSTGRIDGDLIYTSETEAVMEAGATVSGNTTHNLPQTPQPRLFEFEGVASVIGFLMAVVAGGAVILIAPRRAAAVATALKTRPWVSLGWGAIVFFGTPIFIVICMVTIIGIPVGLASIFLYITAILLSHAIGGLFIGYLIVGRFGKTESRGALLGAYTLGFAILTLLKLIPYVGLPLWIATTLFGLGAMVISQRILHPKAPTPATEVAIS